MSIGALIVDISANVAKFQQDMGKVAAIAEEKMKEVDRAVGIVKSSIMAIGATAAVGLTFEGVKKKIDSALESAAGLKELAERTGSTVENLSALNAVAKLSDTGTEQLQVGLQKLAKSMIDLEAGSTQVTAAYAAIGLSTKDLIGLKPDEAFLKVSKAMEGYQDGAGKVAVAQLIMGKSGANLLPVMKDMAEVGEYVAKTTTAQAEQADQLEKMHKRLEASTGALWKRIAFDMLPVMEGFTGSLLEATKKGGGLNGEVTKLANNHTIRDWAENAAVAVAYVVDVFKLLMKTADAVGSSFRVVGADIKVLGDYAKIVSRADPTAMIDLKQDLADRQQILVDANKKYEDLINSNGVQFSNAVKAQIAAARAQDEWMENADAKDRQLMAQQEQKKPVKDVKGAGGITEQYKAYDALLRSIRERIALTDAEANSVQTLTEVQKFAVKVRADIDNGTVKLTLDQKVYVDGLLHELETTDAAVQAIKEFDKATAEFTKERDKHIKQADEYLAQRQYEIDQIGMTDDALARLNAERELERMGFQKGTQDYDTYLKKLSDMDTLQQAAKQNKMLFDTIDGAANQVWLDMFENADNAMKNLNNTLKRGLLQLLYDLTIKKWIIQIEAAYTQSGAGGLGNLFGNLLTSWLTGGSSGGSGAGAGSSFGGGGGADAFGRASSGAGIAAVASMPGRLTATSAPVMSVSVNNVYHIDSRTDRADIMQQINQSSSKTKADVYESLRRGGAFAAAVKG